MFDANLYGPQSSDAGSAHLYIWSHILCLNLRKQLTFVCCAWLYCITFIIYECYFTQFTINQLSCSDGLN
jgi:hypothetical protein